MDQKTLWVLILTVFVPSLLIRLHPTTGESFQFDAVQSQLAAREGVVANAWDTSETYALRRQHPPLLSYVIQLNNRIFGDGPFGARIFSIVFGSLTCLAVAVAIAVLLRGIPFRLPWAMVGGWLLCLLPVHLYVSRTSNWDTVYGFFAAASLACLATYAPEGSKKRLYAAAGFGAGAFLTCELGLSLLPAIGFFLWRDAARLRVSRAALRWAGALLLVVVLCTVLWPAGVLKLDLLRTVAYRWRDSWAAERNLPWSAFYTTIFREAPAFTLFLLFGIVTTLLVPVRRAVIPTVWFSRVLVSSLPFWIYALTVFVLSLKQRLVYVQHIVDMFPPLVIAVCLELATRAGATAKTARRVLGMGATAVVLSAFAAMNPDPEVVGPQEHPGFIGISDALREHPGARVYCYDTLVLGYYLPGASIEGGTSRVWTSDDVERARRGRYDFVVFDRAKLNPQYPTAERVMEALSPGYELEQVVEHRRTQEPVAWILRRTADAHR